MKPDSILPLPRSIGGFQERSDTACRPAGGSAQAFFGTRAQCAAHPPGTQCARSKEPGRRRNTPFLFSRGDKFSPSIRLSCRIFTAHNAASAALTPREKRKASDALGRQAICPKPASPTQPKKRRFRCFFRRHNARTLADDRVLRRE